MYFIIKRFRFGEEDSETFTYTVLSLATRAFLANLSDKVRKVEFYEEIGLEETRLLAFANRSRNDEPFLVKIVLNIF